ncbi:hypothetical protein BH11BAC3_BH11BAC3_19720 [soil metagenome]
MERYINSGGDSGISWYEIEEDHIRIKFFENSRIYAYSYNRAGAAHVEIM